MRLGKILFLLLLSTGCSFACYTFPTLETRWQNLSILAIVQVGPISEAVTPEGVVVQSATATIEKLAYRKNQPHGKNPDEIVLYAVLPNGYLLGDGLGALSLQEGRAFIALPQQGIDRFYKTDPWSFQIIRDGKIRWRMKPAEPISDVSPEEVFQLLMKYGKDNHLDKTYGKGEMKPLLPWNQPH